MLRKEPKWISLLKTDLHRRVWSCHSNNNLKTKGWHFLKTEGQWWQKSESDRGRKVVMSGKKQEKTIFWQKPQVKKVGEKDHKRKAHFVQGQKSFRCICCRDQQCRVHQFCSILYYSQYNLNNKVDQS